MKKDSDINNVHHGKNIKFARTWRGFKHEDLAEKMNLSQSQISLLENQKEIENEIINKIAEILDINSEFITNFLPDEALKSYSFNFTDSTLNINSSENSNDDIVVQGEQENITNNYNNYAPIDKIAELYERILTLNSQLMIAENNNSLLEIEINHLKEHIELLKKN